MEGGALFHDINLAAEQYGLAVVGGQRTTVGYGGYTLEVGMADWLGSMVLPSTVFLRQRSCSSMDRLQLHPPRIILIYFALRGAGACFGICTRFIIQAHDQKELTWFATLVFTRTAIPAIFEVAEAVFQVHCFPQRT